MMDVAYVRLYILNNARQPIMRDAVDYPHADLTGKIIKCCMEAHGFLGPGLPESAYDKAVLKEMGWAHLPFQSEREVPVVSSFDA